MVFDGGLGSRPKPTPTVFERVALFLVFLSSLFGNRKMRTCLVMLFIRFQQRVSNDGAAVQNIPKSESDVEAGWRTQPQQWRNTSVRVGDC